MAFFQDPVLGGVSAPDDATPEELESALAPVRQQAQQRSMLMQGVGSLGRMVGDTFSNTPRPYVPSVAAAIGMGANYQAFNKGQQENTNREIAVQQQRVENRQAKQSMSLVERQQLQQAQQQAAEQADRLSYQKQVLKNQEDDHDIAERRATLDEKRAVQDAERLKRPDVRVTNDGYIIRTNPDGTVETTVDQTIRNGLLADEARQAARHGGGGGSGGTSSQGFYEVPGPNGESTGQYRQKGSTALYTWDGKGFVSQSASGSRRAGASADVRLKLKDKAIELEDKAAGLFKDPQDPTDTVAKAEVDAKRKTWINGHLAGYENILLGDVPEMPEDTGYFNSAPRLRTNAFTATPEQAATQTTPDAPPARPDLSTAESTIASGAGPERPPQKSAIDALIAGEDVAVQPRRAAPYVTPADAKEIQPTIPPGYKFQYNRVTGGQRLVPMTEQDKPNAER